MGITQEEVVVVGGGGGGSPISRTKGNVLHLGRNLIYQY